MAKKRVALPEPRPEDDEDVVWGLSTANALWARGETADALIWVRRAADAAIAAGQGFRASELGLYLSEIEDALAETGPAAVVAYGSSPRAPSSAPIVVDDDDDDVEVVLRPSEVSILVEDDDLESEITEVTQDGMEETAIRAQPTVKRERQSFGDEADTLVRKLASSAAPAPVPAPGKSTPLAIPRASALPRPDRVGTTTLRSRSHAPPSAAAPTPSARPPAAAVKKRTGLSNPSPARTSAPAPAISSPPAKVSLPPAKVSSPPAQGASHVTAHADDAASLAEQAASNIAVPVMHDFEEDTATRIMQAPANLLALSATRAGSVPEVPPPQPTPEPGKPPTISDPMTPASEPDEAMLAATTSGEGSSPPPAGTAEPARKARRAPILDPWAEETPQSAPSFLARRRGKGDGPSQRALNSEGVVVNEDSLVVSVRSRSTTTTAQSDNPDDEVVTSALTLDALRRKKPPPPPPPTKSKPATVPEETARPAAPKDAPVPNAPTPTPNQPSSGRRAQSPPPPALEPPATEVCLPKEAPTPQGTTLAIAPPPPPSSSAPPSATRSNKASLSPPSQAAVSSSRGKLGASKGSIAPKAPPEMASPVATTAEAPPARAPRSAAPPPRSPPPPPEVRPAAPTPPPPAPSAPPSIPVARRTVGGLELEKIEAFADLPHDMQVFLVERARLETLGADEEISGFGAALMLEGEGLVCATIMDTPAHRASAGTLVAARGTIAEASVPLRVVAGPNGARVASWDQLVLDQALNACPWVLDELRAQADRLQALAGATMGPLGDLDETYRVLTLGRLTVQRVAPQEVICLQNSPTPGIMIVGAGDIELLDGEAVDGEVSPGDFLFPSAVLGGSPAPRTARGGELGALLLVGDRKLAQELLVTIPPLIEILSA